MKSLSIVQCIKQQCINTILLSCIVFAALLPNAAFALSNGVVISQVFGGGANAGAPLRNDFFELFNRGTTPASLTGWSIQYAPAASAAWVVVPLSGTLNPGQYYLIQMGTNGGTVGALLPTPDATDPAITNIGATAGKVALVNTTTALTVANPLALPQVIDLVGYGATATGFETAVAPAPSNTQSDIRKTNGCIETDNNSTDFVVTATVVARNKATAVSPCSPLADLVISKSVDKASANSGDALTYTLSINNTLGPNPANGAIVKDVLPAGFTAGTITCAPLGSATCPASITTVNLATGVAIPALPVGGSITITIPGTITGTTNLSNSATVATPTGVTDPITTNNTSLTVNTTVTVLAPPSLAVTKSASVNPFIVGAAGQSYSITIKNNGGVATTAPITLTDVLPAGITTNGVVTAVGGTLSGCPASGVTGCSIAAAIASGASVTLTVPIAVAVAAVGVSGGTNSVTATGGGDANCPAVGPAATCSGITPTVAVLTSASLTTVKKILTVNGTAATTATVIKAGDTLVYDITTTNSGGVAGSTTLTETVPANTTYSLTTEGWSATCAAAASTCTQLVNVAGNSSVSKTFTVKVDASLPVTATNIANVITSSADVTCAACSPTANPIAPASITTIKKLTLINGVAAAVGAIVKAGDTLTYDVTSTNTSGTAGATTLTETVPLNSTYSLTTEGWSAACAAAASTCTQVVAIPGNSNVSKTFTIKIDASLPVTATNIANVVSSSADAICSACAPAANPIAPAIITTVKKLSLINGIAAASGATVKAGDTLTYDITGTNTSGTAGATTLTETVPLNSTYLLTTEGWSAACAVAGSTCTQLVNIAGNSSVSKTFTVKVDASLPVTATNIANIVTSSVDTACAGCAPAANPLAPATITTTKKLALINGVTAIAGATVKAGDILTYDIVSTNASGTAGATTLTEKVPLNSTYSLTTEGWSATCAAAASTCTQLVSVAGNSSVIKAFTVKVDASLPVTATSIANVVTSSADSLCVGCAPPNNPIQVAAITTVKKLSLINGVAATAGATVKAGDTLTYDITSSNTSGTAGVTTLSETVPFNSTYSITTEGWSATPACAAAATSCNQSVAVAGNSSVSKTFTVKVDASLPVTATNIANVVSSSADAICSACAPPANPIAPATITTVKKLSLINGVAAAAGATVKAGDTLTYDITSTNTSGTAGTTTLAEKVPTNTTYNVTTEGWSATCAAAASTCTQLVNVAGNSAVSKIFTVKVDASLPAIATIIANVVTSTADAICAGCAPAANPIAPAIITTVKKLSLINGVAAAAGATVKAGDTLTYDIISTNSSGTAGSTKLTESVPLYTAYSLTTEGWSTTPACVAAASTCTQIVNIAGNSSVSKTFTIKINASLPVTATSIVNVVTSSADSVCAACAPASNPITPASIITTKKLNLINGLPAIAGAIVKAGDNLTYAITSTNTSGTAGITTLTEKVPLNTTYNLTTEGWSATCAAAASSCTQLVNVAGNSSVSQTFTVKVDVSLAATATSIANVVTSSADVTCAACSPTANPIAPASITTIKKLTLINGTAAATGATIKAGDTLTYDITSTNTSGTAGATTLTESVPLHTTYSLTTEGWSATPACAAAASTCTQSVNVAGNSSVSKTFSVKVDASLPVIATSIANTVNSSADVTCAGCAPLANPIAPALSISKTVSANPLVVGALGQFYTITVKNAVGTPTSAAIAVNDNLPAGITINGPVTATGGTLSACPTSGVNLNGCSIAAGVAVGSSVVITVPISIASNAAGTGTGTNTATISGGGDLTCTLATPCGATTPPTDVKAQRIDIAKSVGVPVQTAPLIFQIPYTLAVKNTGTIPATNVQVNDDLSAAFSNGAPVITISTVAAISAGTCAINPTTFNGTTNPRLLAGTDSLAVGGACTINFTVQVTYPNASAIPSTVQNNTAVVTSSAAPPTIPGGAPTGTALVSDNSTNGSAPAAGDTPSATPVILLAGKIDVVKSAGVPKNTAVNTFEIPYAVVIGNVGNNSATVYNVQANDNLAAAFPSATSVKVKAGSYSVVPATCLPNPAFNGVTDTRLLAGASNLAGGQSCTIIFTAEVIFAAGLVPTVVQNNFAFGSITPIGTGANAGYTNTQPPANAVATDISNTGPALAATTAAGTPAVIPSLPSVAGSDNPLGTPTQVVLKINPGKISGSVWDDAANGNKIKDAGEAGVAGWTVEVIDTVTRLPVIGADGQPARAATGADGNYSIANIPPGKWSLQFRAPGVNAQGAVFGVPSNGEQTNGSSPQSTPNLITRSLDIDVTPGATIPQQSLPLDPSGVVYDSATRAPIGGATVTLLGPNSQPVAANLLLPNQQDQLTLEAGANAGGYRFDLLPGAPAGNYTIRITSPVGYTNVSSVLPPQAGSFTPPALPGAPVSLGSGKAPQAGDLTNYYFAFNLTPGTSRDVVHNNIPLDTTDSGALFIRKEVNRASVEIGDALTYRLTVRSTRFAGPGKIVDKLPVGFKLIPNTTKVGATVNSLVAVADPAGSPGPQLTFSVNLPINQEVVIEYKVRVGIGADRGDGTNRAQAQLGALRSLEAQAKVKVSGGVFTRDACVIGKVFVDCNQNKQQDAGEPGIPGVRLYLEDGTNITTDENGQYSICGLRPITHVLKVDSSTMPIGSRMGITSSRNAGDVDSLFVDLTAHELYRADFIEQSCFPKVLEQVNQRRKLGPVLVPQKQDEGKDEKWNIQFNSEQHKLDRTPSVNEGGRQ
jgi:uncharacterized repeat protein (TIGR01451 family)